MTVPASAIGDFPDTKLSRLWLVEATRQFVVCKEQLTYDNVRCRTSSMVSFSLPLHCTYGTLPAPACRWHRHWSSTCRRHQFVNKLTSDTMRCDTIEELNVDSKVECDQLGLAHETKTNTRQCPAIDFPATTRTRSRQSTW